MPGRLKNAVLCLLGRTPEITVSAVYGWKFHSFVIEGEKVARLYVGPGSAMQDVHVFPYPMGSEEFKQHVKQAQIEYE